jgi:hypothetical protein
MAQGDGALYNNLKEQLMEGVFNLASGAHTLKQTLHTGYTPDIDAHALWGDSGVSSTEYGTASGYTAGGKTLGSQDVTQDNTNDRGVFDAADNVWTALGALSPATPSHTILWDDTPTSPADPLIAEWELGSTATNGGDYTLAYGAAGIILLT